MIRFLSLNFLLVFFSSALHFLLAFLLFLVILTYNPFDPSLNVATDASDGSLFVSCLSDFLRQGLGLSSLLIPMTMALIGAVTWRRGQIISTRVLWRCFVAIIPTSLLLSYYDQAGVLGFLFQRLIVSNTPHWLNITTPLVILLFLVWPLVCPMLPVLPKIRFRSKRLEDVVDACQYEIVSEASPVCEEASHKKQPKKQSHSKSSVTSSKKSLVKSALKLPTLDFLDHVSVKKIPVSDDHCIAESKRLVAILQDFGVFGKILGYSTGPLITLYEFEPASGTKSSRIIGLADDIARSMKALSARIAVMPGKNAMGIELPNQHREIVALRELLVSCLESNMDLPLVIGKSISGTPVIADLAAMPHLLVAGTTGSGKSVAINAMILSLLFRHTPDTCRFIMIDPKMLELSVYNDIPHLLIPVVTDPKKAIVALKWVVKEMERRYKLISSVGARNVSGYNARVRESKGEKLEKKSQVGFDEDTGDPITETVAITMEHMPFIVLIVDEMADLMLVAGKEVEVSVQRLSQMARAAGIHIILATQRPSVDVITGVIKANFPTRISFAVTSKIDSRTIINEQGAEQLLRMGDMLFMSGGAKIIRAHGPFVSDQEVQRIANYLRANGKPDYAHNLMEEVECSDIGGSATSEDGDDEDLYIKAVEIVRQQRRVSISYVQRQLRIGYNRSAILVERMEREGVVSSPNHSGKREVLG